MNRRFEQFCVTDPDFFESVSARMTEDDHFTCALRPAPEHWTRTLADEWAVYLPNGVEIPPQGWKVHASGHAGNAEEVLEKVFVHCTENGIAFKFLRSPRVFLTRNSKYAPRGSSGKLATIYPADESELRRVLEELGKELSGHTCPYILSDLRWGEGPLYVRYGGFTEHRRCRTSDGKSVPAIADAEGNLVPDTRSPVFTVPDWVSVPDFLTPSLDARNSVTTGELPYRIDGVLHFSNGGGLYAAHDERTDRKVVLKEARSYAGLDATGRDAITRLRHEHRTLQLLAGVPGVPEVLGYFTLGDHEFLVQEFVEGKPLNKLVTQKNPLLSLTSTATDDASYTAWAMRIHAKVEEIVAALHERGVVHGDIHLHNIVVRKNEEVTLLDFEVASLVGMPTESALRTRAFGAPKGTEGAAVDTYALACLRLALFLPLTSLLALFPGKAERLRTTIAEHFDIPKSFLDKTKSVLPTSATPDPNVRPEALSKAIHASATPHRTDRLFPGDIDQFTYGPTGLAHGAAGVIYALRESGSGDTEPYEHWLRERALTPKPGTPLGLYDGLHGAAFALEHSGHAADALNVLDICLSADWESLGHDLFGGLSGVGLNLAHFASRTGDPLLNKHSVRAGELVADLLDAAGEGPAGLMRGWSGPALLFLRLYETTDDHAYLQLAHRALRRDLDHCVELPDGSLHVDERWRTMPYLGAGSTGIGIALLEYLRHNADAEFEHAEPAIFLAAKGKIYAQPGLFGGTAGILHYLSHRGEPELARAQAAKLSWHAIPYGGGIAMPGEQLLRLSMDLATGTAGVLLALDERAGLPLIGTSWTGEFTRQEHDTTPGRG